MVSRGSMKAVPGLVVVACLASFFAAAAAVAAELERFDFAERHMGTEFRLRFYAASQAEAERAAGDAMARIAELDSRLSDYQPESELNRLSRTAGSGEAVPVSDDLWNLLVHARRVFEASEGAFDITVGPYVRLWRRARGTGQMPSDERLATARAAVGYQFVRLDEQNQTAELQRPGMRLDLGGIAKGYAADEALKVLRGHGMDRALVDAGGDLALGDPPPGEAGWRVAVAWTGDRGQRSQVRGQESEVRGQEGEVGSQEEESVLLRLANCGVATSGDAYQYVRIGGKRYSHIVDPRTGLGVTTSSSITVIAPDCTTADALASAISVLGPQEGLALADATPGVATLIVILEDGTEHRYTSSAMDQLLSGR